MDVQEGINGKYVVKYKSLFVHFKTDMTVECRDLTFSFAVNIDIQKTFYNIKDTCRQTLVVSYVLAAQILWPGRAGKGRPRTRMGRSGSRAPLGPPRALQERRGRPTPRPGPSRQPFLPRTLIPRKRPAPPACVSVWV